MKFKKTRKSTLSEFCRNSRYSPRITTKGCSHGSQRFVIYLLPKFSWHTHCVSGCVFSFVSAMMNAWLLWITVAVVLSRTHHVTSQQGELKIRCIIPAKSLAKSAGLRLNSFQTFVNPFLFTSSGLKLSQRHCTHRRTEKWAYIFLLKLSMVLNN